MKPSAGGKDYDVNWVFPMKYLKYQAVGESMGWIYKSFSEWKLTTVHLYIMERKKNDRKNEINH